MKEKLQAMCEEAAALLRQALSEDDERLKRADAKLWRQTAPRRHQN